MARKSTIKVKDETSFLEGEEDDPRIFDDLSFDEGSSSSVLLSILDKENNYNPGTDNKPFMIGFSLLQSLVLFSPFYKNLRILCCYDWKMKKNRWYLDRLQEYVTKNGEAYLFLPPFLRKEDILSNKSFNTQWNKQ